MLPTLLRCCALGSVPGAGLLIAALAAPLAAAGLPVGLAPGTPGLDSVAPIVLPAIDPAAIAAADAVAPPAGGPVPLRFAVPTAVSLSPAGDGTWRELADGGRVWLLRLTSPGARNLNLALARFEPTPGTRMWLYAPDGATVLGPYTAADTNAAGGLWTALIPGDEVVLEVDVPPGREAGAIEVTGVQRGYRDLAVPATKQGACNIDVVCPEGDGWRDQIRATARITILGAYLCSGQLLNNTAGDDTPYFLTAQHCVETPDEAPTVVLYWNYQAPSCGLRTGGSLAQHQTGTTWVASSPWRDGSDFTLLRLDRAPEPAFNVYFAGWDASGTTPPGGVAIHHPQGAVKAISFDDGPLRPVDYYGAGQHQWRVDAWEAGTTEGGSSGSCLYNPGNGLCVGTLTTGTASCDLPTGFDIFGRFDVHFDGRTTAGERLLDWLDPLGTGVRTLAGKNPGQSSPVTWVVRAAASTAGVGESDWHSQIVVVNPTAEDRTATVWFAADGTPWPGSILTGPVTVPAGASILLDDPLLPLNPTSGLVAVVVDQRGPLVYSRTYNRVADGATFGQGIPGVLIDDVAAATELILPMIHSQPGRYRANLGLVQAAAGTLSVLVEIHAPDGAVLASRSFSTTAAYSQVNNLLAAVGLADTVVAGGWVRVSLTGGDPAWWDAYLSLIDDATDDPTFEEAFRDSGVRR